MDCADLVAVAVVERLGVICPARRGVPLTRAEPRAGNLAARSRDRILALVSALLRPLISLAFLAGVLWFAFSVELGGRTFAEHVDRIGQTPEATDLIEGTRSTVNPVLEEATSRMLGEHIEAPTRAPASDPTHAATASPRALARPRTSTPDQTKLPGRS